MWQVDWALQHHAQYCYQKIMDESWKPLTPLPEPLDQADLAAPPAPTMVLLTINKRDSSLKFPERVLGWHDHADLGAAFRLGSKARAQPMPLSPTTASWTSRPRMTRRRSGWSSKGYTIFWRTEDLKAKVPMWEMS